ncbi:hypothetical protein ABOM_003265 [Aspergillus bombycis]|uniref:Uncharacterized protein n=1 Tax=Aspergillus bombycis TaxID=109264 RepID=A0A1F8A981_9EURO|nr:hypothetical protein ABOM_003265 [Aspergillus bombycis]OGM47848.1 hypothetical protein ABOM_003265 [Aspergillus bombycis]
MVNHSRREASLDRDSSEEERKPTVSPVNEQQTSVVVNPKAIFGSDQPLPQHLTDILQEWHKEKGTIRPPCNSQKPAKRQMEWKTFDRQGNHVNLSAYAIIKPTAYNVLVLHTAEGHEKLVSSYFPFGTGFGTYLIGWSGVHDGWDPTICALRMFSNNLDDLVYKPEAWPAFEVLEKRHKKSQAQTSRVSEKRRSLSGPSQMQRPETRPQRKSLPGQPVATHDHRTNNAHERSSSSSSEEEESDEEDDTSGSSESSEDDEPEPTSVSKRRRLNEPSEPTHQDAKVVFKLFSYKSGAVRCFPLDECQTGKEFFDKARTFFQLFDKHAEVKILSCQIASQPLQQYVFEGSEGEFNLLVDQAKSLVRDGLVIVEVSHVLSLSPH